jgi:trigger factor
LDIQLEKNSATEALIKINLKEADYESKFREKLKTYSKQAQIKGFRTGKVPVSLIEKMYGKSIKAEEINNILVESLKDYIKSNDIKLIGDPLPNNEKAEEIDWEHQTEFEFEYQVGLIDNFEYKLDVKVNKYEIKVEKKVVDEAIEDLKVRYGKMTNPAESVEGDSVFGTLRQESTDYSQDGLLEIEKVAKKLRKSFVGVKSGDTIEFDIQKLFAEPEDLEGFTNLSKEEVAKLNGQFAFEVKNINRVEPATMDQEFFDKIFGEGKVKSEEEFMAEYAKIIEENYQKESDYLLSHQLQEKIQKETKMEVPEDFYKKWLIATNKELTEESLNEDFEHYVRDLKWNLLKNRLSEDLEIKVENDDLIDYTKSMFKAQFGAMDVNDEMDEHLVSMANNYLQQNDGENYLQVYSQLRTERIVDALKQKAQISVKKVSRDEFSKKAGQPA